MYSIERYLGKFKRYVRNRSKQEGSIAEGYLVDECVIFFARFFGNNVSRSLNEFAIEFKEPWIFYWFRDEQKREILSFS